MSFVGLGTGVMDYSRWFDTDDGVVLTQVRGGGWAVGDVLAVARVRLEWVVCALGELVGEVCWEPLSEGVWLVQAPLLDSPFQGQLRRYSRCSGFKRADSCQTDVFGLLGLVEGDCWEGRIVLCVGGRDPMVFVGGWVTQTLCGLFGVPVGTSEVS